MTDIQPANQQPMSDDQELAKVLAGITSEAGAVAADDPATEPIETTVVSTPVDPTPPQDSPVAVEPSSFMTPTTSPAPEPTETEDSVVETTAPKIMPSLSPSPDGDLEGIKKDALIELRPLVDKLELAPDEKFDTYLLLLRSTDDKELIAPAHEAAKNIPDEARRAQALLDIIKEIDYLSGQKPA